MLCCVSVLVGKGKYVRTYNEFDRFNGIFFLLFLIFSSHFFIKLMRGIFCCSFVDRKKGANRPIQRARNT